MGDLSDGGVQPHWIVEAFDVAEAGDLGFGLRREFPAREQFALERREEALTHGIVVSVADRPHRWPNTDLAAPAAEGKRGVLGGFKWSSEHPSEGSFND